MAAWRHDHAPREPATKDSPNGCEQDRQFSFIGSRCMVCCFIVESNGYFFATEMEKIYKKMIQFATGSSGRHLLQLLLVVWEASTKSRIYRTVGKTRNNPRQRMQQKSEDPRRGHAGQVEWVRRSQSPTCPPSSVLRMHENDTGTTAHTFLVVLLGHLGRWWSLVVVVVVVANTPTHLAISWCQQRRDWIFTRGSLITIWLSR